ncbi:MAG: hypothetical protein MZV64_29605 [Ignavibacteriales bacterium]|nr:hypothetical protein [Ignavibacteriales bacterium]
MERGPPDSPGGWGKEIVSGVRITIQGQPIDTVTTVSCLRHQIDPRLTALRGGGADRPSRCGGWGGACARHPVSRPAGKVRGSDDPPSEERWSGQAVQARRRSRRPRCRRDRVSGRGGFARCRPLRWDPRTDPIARQRCRRPGSLLSFGREESEWEGLRRSPISAYRIPSRTKAMAWLKLSIDARVVEGLRTMMVGRWPWDGSFSGRDNLRPRREARS